MFRFLIVALALCIPAVAQVSRYVPPSLVSLGDLNPKSGSAGAVLNATTSVTNGSSGQSWITSVTYSGPTSSISATLTASGFRVAISATDVIGAYTLQSISFVETSGITVYRRNGTIDRLFYDASGLSTTHSFSFSALDFSIVAPPPVAPPTFTSQPASVSVLVGQDAAFVAAVAATAPTTYQWRKAGAPIPGATTATLSLTNVTTTDSGNYDVVATNAGGSTTSSTATLTVTVPATATITAQPISVRASAGQSASFTVAFASSTPTSVQWRKNSTPISGATSTTLSLSSLTPADAGAYDAVITNAAGITTTLPATLTVEAGRVKNISVRIVVADNGVLTAGFVIDTPKAVLVRGVGRSLEQFGVAPGTTMQNPRIEVYNAAGLLVAQNEDFTPSALLTTTTSRVGAFALSSSQDAALMITLQSGAYTVQLKPTGGRGGDALLEVYDVD